MKGVRDLVKAYETLGIKAATAFPAGMTPQVPINDKRFYPIYAKCIELDIPICITTGVPGPRVPMLCQKTELLDEVCWFFPELKVVMRHGAEPWDELAVKLMLKWPNLYYSTSAFAPRYYPQSIIDYANTRGAEKVMYAGYFPMGLSLERIFSELPHVGPQGRRVAQVPARERRAGVRAGGLTMAQQQLDRAPFPVPFGWFCRRLPGGLPRRRAEGDLLLRPPPRGVARRGRACSTCRTRSARTSAPTSATAAPSRAARSSARSTAGSSTPRA